jgi:uncharacterized protein (TIGR02271 family)
MVVTGKDGLRGTIVEPSQFLSHRESQVRVRLDSGREVLVPTEALIRQSDGTYYVSRSLTELEFSTPGMPVRETVVMPVMVEELDVSTRQVETEAVRIIKTVHEREELVDQPLLREEVEIERVVVNRVVDGPIPVRYEGETMIVPVLEEVLVVEKRLMLKEELHISKRQIEVHQPQSVTLRSEEATIKRTDHQEEKKHNNKHQ